MELNLEAKNREQQRIKAYLEENASDILAGKINNGVLIKKDGKILLNRKTLDSFMSFATEEARKQAEKGARYAMVEDDVVFGWAVHYFEEDSIEGTLYNEDGSEYKTQPKPAAKAPTVKAQPKPQPKPQMSMFDLMGEDLEGKPEEEKPEDDEDAMPSDEELQEIMAEIAEEEKAKQQKPTTSPVYRKYLDVQDRYPQAIKPLLPCAWATSMKCSARMQRCLQTNFLLPLRAEIADLKAVCRWSVSRIILRRCTSAKS